MHKSRQMISVALSLSINAVALFQKVTKLVQARFALCEAMLCVTNHVLIFHMPLHSFQEYLLHDLAGHRCEIDWPIVPQSFFFSPFLKMGVMFIFFFVMGEAILQ